MSRFSIAVPPGFDFWGTVLSHGWAVLPPFACDREARTLHRVFRVGSGRLVVASMRAAGRRILIDARPGVPGASGMPGTGRSVTMLTPRERFDLRAQVRTCFRLEEDFSDFHAIARRYARFRWIAASGAGRLLRAPTVYEDVVKMICTTNCSWRLTEAMVGKLVRTFGEDAGADRRAFPLPSAVAASSERMLRSRCGMGYRTPYVLEFSRRVADGKLDVEALRTSGAPADELDRTLRSIRGVGPYAAENLLRLLGKYDRLGLDSWVRGQYARIHAGGRAVTDARIERHYRPLGAWRGLFFWLEMTRSWYDRKFPPVDGGAGS